MGDAQHRSPGASFAGVCRIRAERKPRKAIPCLTAGFASLDDHRAVSLLQHGADDRVRLPHPTSADANPRLSISVILRKAGFGSTGGIPQPS